MTSATITLSYKSDPANHFIYQNILISPSKRSHIRYFTMEKYSAGRKVDDLLSTLYVGDGLNVFFRHRQKFRNQIIIKYEIVNPIELDLKEKKFHISAEVPKYDGCQFCQHLRPSSRGQSRCALYKKFLDRLKIFCSDFLEKD
jgi:hypothetical protein